MLAANLQQQVAEGQRGQSSDGTSKSDGSDGGRVLIQSLNQAVISARIQDVDQTVPAGRG